MDIDPYTSVVEMIESFGMKSQEDGRYYLPEALQEKTPIEQINAVRELVASYVNEKLFTALFKPCVHEFQPQPQPQPQPRRHLIPPEKQMWFNKFIGNVTEIVNRYVTETETASEEAYAKSANTTFRQWCACITAYKKQLCRQLSYIEQIESQMVHIKQKQKKSKLIQDVIQNESQLLDEYLRTP